MPRRGTVPKRDVLPDPLYNSTLVTKFVNCLMTDGKKSTAQLVFYDALETIGTKLDERPPIEVFEQANFQNLKVSLKASDVLETIRAYQLLARQAACPFHLGVTEAGMPLLDALLGELVPAALALA